MSKPLIEVKDLKVYFKQKSPKLLSFKPGILKAVAHLYFFMLIFSELYLMFFLRQIIKAKI